MGNEYHVALRLRDPDFKTDSVVLVTGASSGLGKEIALVYAERRAHLVLVARDRARLDDVTRQCQRAGAKTVVALQADVGKEEDAARCLEVASKEWGRVDVLVLNAGVNAHSRFEEVKDLGVLDQLLRVNLRGYVNFARYGLPLLRQCGGRIVVISSMSGEVGLAERSLYCASKFAVNGFFQALRKEVPVPITLVSLPSIDTPMREHDLLGAQSHGARPSLGPQECARVVVEMADRRVEKVVFPLKAYLGVYLRPFMRKTIDYFIDRSAKL